MRQLRQKGFVVILAVMAIAVIGMAMFALAGIANTMQFQSNNAYLNACERNLLSSGLVWARQNIQNKAGKNFNKTIQLDVSRMDIRASALDVTISVQSDKEAEVRVNTSCSRGRQTLKGSGKYRIEL